MRIAPSLTFASSLFIGGCSSYSATVTLVAPSDAGTDAGDTGGTANTGGASTNYGTATGGSSSAGGATPTGGNSAVGGGSTTGGVAATGGSSNAGGAIPTGGTSAVGGGSASGGASTTGGASQTGGTFTAGGVSSTGGTSSIAGANSSGGVGGGTRGVTGGTRSTGGASATGGAVACSKNTDCANPDPINCSYTCVNPGATGTCKPAALIGPTQCATSACDDKAISGFWDAQGKPHIAYGFTETDGSGSIRMQELKLDGSLDGAAVVYALPSVQQLHEPGPLSANAQGGKVAFFWVGVQDVTNGADLIVLEFATTDLAGANTSAPMTLDSSPAGVGVNMLWLDVTAAGAWLALTTVSHSSPAVWEGATGSTIAALSSPSLNLFSGEFAFGVLGNTLMLTGSDCAFASQCVQSFDLDRFSLGGLTAIGAEVTLSQNFQPNEWPAMGPVNGTMALLWTETQSPGQVFRTLINEDGTFAMAPGTVQSAISPKAVVQASDGGALLIGTIASGTPAKYQLVAQKLDGNLNFIGNPLPVADGESADATGFETRLSGDDTQVLVTFHQNGARYRLLSTVWCR